MLFYLSVCYFWVSISLLYVVQIFWRDPVHQSSVFFVFSLYLIHLAALEIILRNSCRLVCIIVLLKPRKYILYVHTVHMYCTVGWSEQTKNWTFEIQHQPKVAY